MCSERDVKYDVHLYDAIQRAFTPLQDIEDMAERIAALETFVTILDAEGLTKGENLDGLVTAAKVPGIQKLLEAVYGKIRDLGAANERVLSSKRGEKGKKAMRARAKAEKAVSAAYRTVAAKDLFKSAFRHQEICETEVAPAAAKSSGAAEDSDERDAYAGIESAWFEGSSTDGIVMRGIWNYVVCLNSQVLTLTSCSYGCVGLETGGAGEVVYGGVCECVNACVRSCL